MAATAHAKGKQNSKDWKNCFVNSRVPQWALTVLERRGQGADAAANGSQLKLTDPAWNHYQCNYRTHDVSYYLD
jgi:hypothetical protein